MDPITSLFDKLYGADDQTVSAEKKPLVRKALKRKFYAAFDDAEGQKLDAMTKMDNLRRNFDNLDLNAILAQRTLIDTLTKMQDSLKEEFQITFGEQLDTSRN